jgi:hypothetical protein
MSSRNMCLLPRATLHSDSEQELLTGEEMTGKCNSLPSPACLFPTFSSAVDPANSALAATTINAEFTAATAIMVTVHNSYPILSRTDLLRAPLMPL